MKKYIKNGKEYILCNSRKKLIQITPEEIIRQEFITKLITEYRVPADLIDAEVPLSYYQKGRTGRADIIVSGFDEKHNERIPLMVVECKAPNVYLTDKVLEQVMNYDDLLETQIMVITNGLQTICYSWSYDIQDYRMIKSIPLYPDLIKGIGIDFAEEIADNWIRPDHKDDIDKNHELLLADYIIGEDTDKKLVPLIANLVGLIYDDKAKANHLNLKDKIFVSDGGLRYTTFGNAAGGDYTGDYRYFILQNEEGETELVSISIMGNASVKNHPKWGNRMGYTILHIAIDDLEKSHNALEYCIDRFVTIENDFYSFRHDGTLTVGKKGRVKNADVINFIKMHYPHLVRDNKIYLGSIDNSKPFRWEDEDVNNLIANFIEYGFARDEFRKMYK